jgi:hypothetical protein
MHLRTTFFLLVLTLLVASLVVVDQTSDNNSTDQTRTSSKLLDFEPERVTYWSFTGTKGSVECMNEHGQWMIAKPFKTRAKDARVNYMLSVLSSLTKSETITADQRKARALSLKDYGLEKPDVRFILGSPDKRITINIGNLAPLKDCVYVQLDENNTVFAASPNLLDIIPRGLSDIRDNHLISGSPAHVKKLEIKSVPSPLIQVVKEGPEWIIHKPVMTRADWVRISGFLDSLFKAQIDQYVTDTMTDPSLYGLNDDEAVMQIGVWQNDIETGEYILFGKKADEKGDFIYACLRGQSSVFKVKAEILNSLNMTLNNIRDARLFFMAPDSFASIRVEEGNNVLTLLRDPKGNWQITEPKQWKADDKTVEALVNRLNSLRIEMVLPAANTNTPSLEKPAKIITVTNGETNITQAAVTRILQLSPAVQGQEYVLGRFTDEDEIYQLSATAIATISLNPLSYRVSNVLMIDSSAVRKIIQKKDNREQIVVREDSGRWRAISPADSTPNQTAINDILAGAEVIRAVRFEPAADAAVRLFGLQTGARTVTFILSGQESISKTIVIGENAEEKGVYAMIQGQEFVFVLEKKLVDTLLRDITQPGKQEIKP